MPASNKASKTPGLSEAGPRVARILVLLSILFRYLAFIKAIEVSSMRFEKPHSLSYQDKTLTKRPFTLVSDLS